MSKKPNAIEKLWSNLNGFLFGRTRGGDSSVRKGSIHESDNAAWEEFRGRDHSLNRYYPETIQFIQEKERADGFVRPPSVVRIGDDAFIAIHDSKAGHFYTEYTRDEFLLARREGREPSGNPMEWNFVDSLDCSKSFLRLPEAEKAAIRKIAAAADRDQKRGGYFEAGGAHLRIRQHLAQESPRNESVLDFLSRRDYRQVAVNPKSASKGHAAGL